MRAGGIPEYTIPGGDDAGFYAPITYVEPLSADARRALGFDSLTDPVRRAALERARDTGRPAATASTVLITEVGAPQQRSVLLYVPVYRGGGVPETVEARRNALQGFVFTGWRMDDLMAGLFTSGIDERLAFAIVDGPTPMQDQLLYASDGAGSALTTAALIHPDYLVTLPVAGRTWTLAFIVQDAANTSGQALIALVAAVES